MIWKSNCRPLKIFRNGLNEFAEKIDKSIVEIEVVNEKKHEVSIVHSFVAEYLTFITYIDKSDVNAVYSDESLWLTQKMMGLLYNVGTHTIN